MKRAIVAFLLFWTAVMVHLNAQEHLRFMNIPIEGTMRRFAAKMETKGFVLDYAEEDGVQMTGTFIGRDCNLYMFKDPKTEKFRVVSVCFKKKYNSWYSLKGSYTKIVNGYIGKYGNPSKTAHTFLYPYYEGDGYEMSAVRSDNCRYWSYWEFDEGNIIVTILKDAKIMIYYRDKLNGEERENKIDFQDYYDDI